MVLEFFNHVTCGVGEPIPRQKKLTLVPERTEMSSGALMIVGGPRKE